MGRSPASQKLSVRAGGYTLYGHLLPRIRRQLSILQKGDWVDQEKLFLLGKTFDFFTVHLTGH